MPKLDQKILLDCIVGQRNKPLGSTVDTIAWRLSEEAFIQRQVDLIIP